jgi:hypothetical protein
VWDQEEYGKQAPEANASQTRSRMIRIAITRAAYEAEANERGERLIWLEDAVADRLRAMREPGESYSDVILRLVELETKGRP